jgi:hypothetical protein
MHSVALAFQRRLEETQKSLLIVNGENATFLTAITSSHVSRMSNYFASRLPDA